jgi:hypothetical protein
MKCCLLAGCGSGKAMSASNASQETKRGLRVAKESQPGGKKLQRRRMQGQKKDAGEVTHLQARESDKVPLHLHHLVDHAPS